MPMSVEKMDRLRLWLLLLLFLIVAALVRHEHGFHIAVVACGALAGQLLWRAFGRPGRRWLLFAVGPPVALALAGLAVLAQSRVFPHSPRRVEDTLALALCWVFGNVFSGWLTNPNPGQKTEQQPQHGTV